MGGTFKTEEANNLCSSFLLHDIILEVYAILPFL